MNLRCPDPAAESLLRLLAGQALSRAGGAPLVSGNSARILKDAGEHYPVWLSAIGTAQLDAGGEVRSLNPTRLASPFGWLARAHRKMLAVDGRIGFVTGLCVSRKWLGDPAKGIAPWRDTGIEVRGPSPASSRRLPRCGRRSARRSPRRS